MPEQNPTASDLLAQILEFETTISDLQRNVISLRQKIIKNKDQFGEDVSSWPNM